jgi:DNA-binding CsgD family transcriptional regulator
MTVDLEAFVDRIYEAAAVPELWRGVLVDFARLAGADEAGLSATRGSTSRWIVSSPDADEIIRVHLEDFPTNERTRRLMAARHAGFLRDCDVFEAGEIESEPIFRDFLIPRGFGSGLATTIFAPSADFFIIHAERPLGRGPFSREVVARVDGLRPHFARAALLSSRLEMERVSSTAAALELIGLAAAVLGQGGRTLAANRLLTEMMPDVVLDRPSRLALAESDADELLVNALESLKRKPDGTVRSIPVRATEGRPATIIHIVPVRGAACDVFAMAEAILVATPLTLKEGPAPDVVQGLFDLTPGESRIATMVGSGLQLRESAIRLGITEETARSVLKRVLAKTGVHRQAELVGLLQGVPVARRRPPRD